MSAALILGIAWVVTLALWFVCDWGNDDIVRELKAEVDTLARENESLGQEADYWHDAFVALSRNSSNVRSIRDAPRFDAIAEQLAANEAARADWDEPASWGDPA